MAQDLTREQVYRIMLNLNNLEISFLDYSHGPIDYMAYRTYLNYMDSFMIKSHNLFRMYLCTPLDIEAAVTNKTLSDIGVVSEAQNILPGYDLSFFKMFSFPDGPLHSCEYFTLLYQLEKSSRLCIEDSAFDLNPGDFYLIPPGNRYCMEIPPESLVCGINIRHAYMEAKANGIFMEDPRIVSFLHQSPAADELRYLAFHTAGSEQVRDLFLDAYALFLNDRKYANHALHCYLNLLFAVILGDAGTTIDSSAPISRNDSHFLEIRDYLEQNYKEATLQSVSDAVHFSKQYVCHIVKEATGDTFNNLLLGIRLEIAAQYLADSNLSLEGISELTGFKASSHLSRVFKNAYGVTPSEYRKTHHPA